MVKDPSEYSSGSLLWECSICTALHNYFGEMSPWILKLVACSVPAACWNLRLHIVPLRPPMELIHTASRLWIFVNAEGTFLSLGKWELLIFLVLANSFGDPWQIRLCAAHQCPLRWFILAINQKPCPELPSTQPCRKREKLHETLQRKSFTTNAVFALLEVCWKCKQSKAAPADTAC